MSGKFDDCTRMGVYIRVDYYHVYFQDILGHLTQFDARQSDNVDELNKYAKIFLEYGGIEVMF
jgi:hypothetical protein